MEKLLVLVQSGSREPWNNGKLVGQKAPLRLKEIWAIRIRLQLAERTRELASFNLAVDSKLRSCDLVTLRVRDITHGERIGSRAIVMQQKTQRPVQFEITEQKEWPPSARYSCGGKVSRCGAVRDEARSDPHPWPKMQVTSLILLAE
jgi:hypothetical protein